MTRICESCGQEILRPRMGEVEYRDLLKEIAGSRGRDNRIVKWITDIEREEGLIEAIFTLEDYMKGG